MAQSTQPRPLDTSGSRENLYPEKMMVIQYRNATKNVAANTSPWKSILFVHSPRSASSEGLLLNSTHAVAPELSITTNNVIAVIQCNHGPMLPTNECAAKSTTKIAAATQNTNVTTGSASRIRRKKVPCCGRCTLCPCPLSCGERYISCSLPHHVTMLRMYLTPVRQVARHSNAVFITRLFGLGCWVAQGELL